jgi:hypothetical protein
LSLFRRYLSVLITKQGLFEGAMSDFLRGFARGVVVQQAPPSLDTLLADAEERSEPQNVEQRMSNCEVAIADGVSLRRSAVLSLGMA